MLQTTFELLTEFSTRIVTSDRRSAQTVPKVSCLGEGLKIFIKDFLDTLVPYNTFKLQLNNRHTSFIVQSVSKVIGTPTVYA